MQYKAVYLLFCKFTHSTCFECQPHPSSGVHKTLTTASGTGHIFRAATSLQRGQVNLATLAGGSCTVPEAVVTVLCTPDDGCGWHPKHVEWTFRIINRLLCVASRWTIINIYHSSKLNPWSWGIHRRKTTPVKNTLHILSDFRLRDFQTLHIWRYKEYLYTWKTWLVQRVGHIWISYRLCDLPQDPKCNWQIDLLSTEKYIRNNNTTAIQKAIKE